MHSFSELEFSLIVKDISIEDIFRICFAIEKSGFFLNTKSPGYSIGAEEHFQYPNWKNLPEAKECLSKSGSVEFGINYISKGHDYLVEQLSLEANLAQNYVSFKTPEIYITEANRLAISRSKLFKFVSLVENFSSMLSVIAWKIAQTGFEHISDGAVPFIRFRSGVSYPRNELEKTISWYESHYLNRWTHS